MNLLDSASLVVTPNGYKASKLYSIVPTDGTGDMTFARTGDTATRVNSSGLIESVTANKPRLDYFNSTCPKLLLEPQRSNLFLRSEEFNLSPWDTISTATVTANAIASPSGSVNADKLVENTASSNHFIYQTVTLADNTDYTFTCFVKAGERTLVDMRIQAKTTLYLDNINLTTGVATSGTLTSYGNGWWRYSRTINSGTGSTTPFFSPWLRNASGNVNYTGDGTSGIYLWGVQVEAGAYATSYIPTTTASVTRNADLASLASATALIGQTEGTIFWDVNIYGVGQVYESLLNIDNGSFGDTINLATANTINFGVYDNGVIQASGSIAATIGRHKIALAYKANDFVFYVDGVLRHTDTSGTIPTLNRIQLGNGALGPSQSHINSAALWKTRLQNSELATLTSL